MHKGRGRAMRAAVFGVLGMLAVAPGKDYLDGGGGSDTAKRVGKGDRVVSCNVK